MPATSQAENVGSMEMSAIQRTTDSSRTWRDVRIVPISEVAQLMRPKEKPPRRLSPQTTRSQIKRILRRVVWVRT
jgi:hypothetical protein